MSLRPCLCMNILEKMDLFLSQTLKIKDKEKKDWRVGGRGGIRFTVQRWSGRAAWETRNRATATSLLRCQFLFNLFQPSTFLETAHTIHNSWRHMCSHTRLATIRVDWKNMGRPTKSTDHNPATVMAEADVLYLEMRYGKTETWLKLLTLRTSHTHHQIWIEIRISLPNILKITL